jgi:tetratricopeptide (TPR) repeat protein
VALAGVVFDLGFEGPTLERIEDGLRTARALGVGTLIALSARAQGDSVAVTAARYDARAGRQLGKPLESRGARADPFRLAAGIVHGVLGLSGPIEDIERLREHSSNPAALQRYDAGLDLMERWRLAEAERAFREAVALDSTFAMAHHHLAQVLYWQGADQIRGLARLGPEAVRLSRTALRHTEGLAAWEREHVAAFNRFLEGDYQEARERYGALLARDSTDVYAWLLGGIVEFRDPWLAQGADGSLRPRGDLNAARQAFTETTRLNPGFHIGYGHLFDITSEALNAATRSQSTGFERPGHELVPVWESRTDPNTLEAFGLVYSDSLAWLPEPAFESLPRARLEDGALRLLETSLRTLRRWAAYAPDEHRPHTELATWTMRQRDLLPAPQPPERLDSLAEAALLHAERALELVADTVPEDVIRLANLSLAAGRAERARELVLSAVERSPRGDVLPRATSNALLFIGDVEAALALLRRGSARTFHWEDPATGRMLHDGGTEPLVRRLVTLGATGASEGLAEAFAELEAAWATPSEGRMPIERLRVEHAPSLAPALAMYPEALARWRVEADLSDPLWDALALDPSDRLAALPAALAEPDPQVPDPIRSYLLGTAALEAGEAGLALRLFHRLDSIPLGTDTREDPGWGLLALSLYRRGQALELRGDTAAAMESFRRFIETRAGVASAPFAAAARERLARLGAGGP